MLKRTCLQTATDMRVELDIAKTFMSKVTCALTFRCIDTVICS